MKLRIGWVSNSSSCSFYITNKTDQIKTMKEFAEETKYLVDEYNKRYYWNSINVEDYLEAAESEYDYVWKPQEKLICVFGDEHYNAMGIVLDYMLRDCEDDETESFCWSLKRILR